MSPRAAAAAVARGAAATVHAPARTRPARRPAPTRRRSGAAARPATRVAVPRYDFVSLLDRLLRGPAYIAVVGILLAGIVFFNVDVLELNHGIARTDVRATQLKRQNAALTLQLAKLGSSERIQHVALQRGLVLPQPGDVRYLRAHPEDAVRALRVMTAPDPSGAAAGVPMVTQGGETVTQSAQSATTAPSSAQSVPATTTAAPAASAPSQTTPQSTATPTAQSTPTPATQPTNTTQAGAAAAPATP